MGEVEECVTNVKWLDVQNRIQEITANVGVMKSEELELMKVQLFLLKEEIDRLEAVNETLMRALSQLL